MFRFWWSRKFKNMLTEETYYVANISHMSYFNGKLLNCKRTKSLQLSYFVLCYMLENSFGVIFRMIEGDEIF